MKKILFAAAAAAALLASGSAMAEGEFSYNVAVTSDYVWRGVSQTDENPAISGGIDYSNGIFYAGTWASNVDFGSDADYELDLYAGVKPTVGDFAFDFGVLYYAYPQEDDLNMTELKAAVSYPLGKGSIGAAAYVNTDEDLEDYFEVNGAYPLTDKISVSGAYGDFGGYNTWNVGGSYALTDILSVDLRYHDTDTEVFGQLGDERVALTLKAAF
ncbi:TorF family putative porin [Asticcacaulis machinosus]|uniref:TorF family putative porin n=1 Tax=Asticcacaulis machinosus TaxID=2984211 RepID=A0ABT5HEJ1_9CAUL|nr:TorF family putative porin [Asticcacaulis machinosus]MDC7674672.1 TorF family putative porin [Asticcacaulis machinosus]